ncbi:MAG: carbohydrate ABC transporter permease [Phycisphaeraceae bacterium]|nr:carbohydrate ABC transporter permease [Phycisphaeraceae bacterium]
MSTQDSTDSSRDATSTDDVRGGTAQRMEIETNGPPPPQLPRVKVRSVPRARVLGLHVLLGVLLLLTLLPIAWLVTGALKLQEDLFAYTFLPEGWRIDRLTFSNIFRLFEEIPFFRVAANSMFVAGATVLIQLFFSSLGGFALAKYEFRGKRPIMILMLMTMMIPAQVMLAPLYQMIHHMGLMDSLAGLIVPSVVSVFGMFLFRQSMMQIPDELLQAGRIDGCSELGLYWNIVMPVSRPMIGAFCLIAFMGNWNSFLWPQIVLHTSDRFTLPIALTQQVGLYEQDYGVLLAGTLLSIVPVVILFLLLQREFISGLTAGAVKG